MANAVFKHSWTIPEPGETIAGKYLVNGFCGRSGLAVVLSATHAGLAQRVAIKMLLPEWAGNPEIVDRFEREGRAASRVNSEHVVRVFDVGTLETGAPYWVLEYLEGNNLEDVLAMWGPLPIATAVDWVLQAAEAIVEARAYGIVHRDLKPANLFLTSRADGSAFIKLIDFGLSKLSGTSVKLTRPSDVMGSPHYMAPEQLRGEYDADARADLWSLGAVLHQLLTGQPPFRGETLPELCAAVLTQAPPRLSSLHEGVPHELEKAVLRCLQKEPGARFSDVAELARALVSFGTDSARRSCGRIERVLVPAGRPADIVSLPPLASESLDERLSWPELEDEPLPRGKGASAKIVLGSVLILGGAAAAAFLGMYSYVHSGGTEVARLGVAEHQPTAPAVTNMSAAAIPSAPLIEVSATPTTAMSVPAFPAPVASPAVSPPPAVAPLPAPTVLGIAKVAAPSIPVPAPTMAVAALARVPTNQFRTAPPAQTQSEPPSKVRRYTVEPAPVRAPTEGRLEEPPPVVGPAEPTSATTPISTPPPTTDDPFDSRE